MKKLFWIFGLLFFLSMNLFSHPQTPAERLKQLCESGHLSTFQCWTAVPLLRLAGWCSDLVPKSECLSQACQSDAPSTSEILFAQQTLAFGVASIYVTEFVNFMLIPVRWGFTVVTFPLWIVGVLS